MAMHVVNLCVCVCVCGRMGTRKRTRSLLRVHVRARFKSQSSCRQVSFHFTQLTFDILPIVHRRTGSPVCTSHIFTIPAVSADAIISRPCPSAVLAAVTKVTGCECTAGSTDRKGTRVSYIRTCTRTRESSYADGRGLREASA
jgi:hypothetical protein